MVYPAGTKQNAVRTVRAIPVSAIPCSLDKSNQQWKELKLLQVKTIKLKEITHFYLYIFV